MKTILIIDHFIKNWDDLFIDYNIDHQEKIKIVHSNWEELKVTSLSGKPCAIKMGDDNQFQVIRPDLIFIHSPVKSAHPKSNYINIFLGLFSLNVPCVNSLQSIYMCLERPIVHNALKQIQVEVGNANFPLIPQHYLSNYASLSNIFNFPFVLKLGHVHAGFGKVLIKSDQELEDLKSILAMQEYYILVEPFIRKKSDIRIQKIGDAYRVVRHKGKGWKGKGEVSLIEELDLKPRYKTWIDRCSELFGGLDLLALDILESVDGKEYILELNDTAIGFASENEIDDMEQVKDLLLAKLSKQKEFL